MSKKKKSNKSSKNKAENSLIAKPSAIQSIKSAAASNDTISGKCFISHCTDDEDILNALTEVLNRVYNVDIQNDNEYFFCTFHNSILPGQMIPDELNKQLHECSTMIALITDSYLRSYKAIYEFCNFASTKKTIIPIVYNGEPGLRFVNDLLTDQLITIDISSTDKSTQELSRLFFKSISEYKIAATRETESSAVELINTLFISKAKQGKTLRPFIGCSDERYNDVIKPCEEKGITKVRMGGDADFDKLRLSECSELYIVSTTGGRLVKALAEKVIPHILLRQGEVTFLLPNLESDFCRDVAEFEDYYKRVKHNYGRIGKEFEDSVNYLKECFVEAEREAARSNKTIGKIKIGCTFSLLRQTVIVGVDGDHVTGWFAATIPPQRTSLNTPTFDFSSKNVPHTLGNAMLEHARELRNFAAYKGKLIELNNYTDLRDGFFLEKQTAEAYWAERLDEAKDNMARHKKYSCVLIEAAAQHPLKDHCEPGAEFAARLDRAAVLYEELVKEGKSVKIYVPGSLHHDKTMGEEFYDNISLSEAGVNYLREKGIPSCDLLGDDMNKRYKGNEGVYNSADECYVASMIFKRGKYKMIYCVCSPNQMMRKKLYYIDMGVLPQFYTVPLDSDDMYHGELNEIFGALPKIIYEDHNWQSPDSEAFINSRRSRKPDYKEQQS